VSSNAAAVSVALERRTDGHAAFHFDLAADAGCERSDDLPIGSFLQSSSINPAAMSCLEGRAEFAINQRIERHPPEAMDSSAPALCDLLREFSSSLGTQRFETRLEPSRAVARQRKDEAGRASMRSPGSLMKSAGSPEQR
jgi:hypothetical protein